MKLQVQVVFIFLCCLFWVQIVLCDEIANTSATIKWTCSCSSNHSGVLQLNCSNSCICNLDGGGNGDRWICLCGDGAFPSIASENQDTACFTSCNCTSGSANEVQVPEKHTSSSKVVVVVLLLCILLTTMALVSSIMCYFYRKEKCPIDASIHSSSNKRLSTTSASNLISKRSTVPETKLNIFPSINPFTGCCFLFKSNPETLHGTIYQFSYSELENATDNFSNSNRIGLGGSSCVYRGQLRDGRTVAIKRIKDHGSADADAVFSTEVDLLSRLNHFHVVPMIGYCSEHRGRHVERLLVFEYVPNGNLRDCLDGENMNWETRVLIAIGAARGLEYLHEAAAPRILHSDVKSTNILLDESWRAKIADLGMAKYLKADDDGIASCSSSPARIMQGTFGYFAPEYAIVGRASLKSDVFSFGVVLLELITGQHPIIHKSNNSKGSEESLVIWAMPRLQDSRRVISELPDPRLKGSFPEEEMQIVAYLAKECLLLDPDDRPTMTEVVQILSTIAPDKTRMRNIHAGLYQWSSFNSTRAEINSEGLLGNQVKHPIEEAEEEVQKGGPSLEYVERLILLSSNARSWRALDEVDLVEPRFESFCVSNFKSP